MRVAVKAKKCMNMKKILLISILLFSGISFSACKKKNACKETVTITKTGTPCSQWAIQAAKTYPSANIPDEFKQEGVQVCVEYELYEDMRLCACCGGTWAKIKSIQLTVD